MSDDRPLESSDSALARWRWAASKSGDSGTEMQTRRQEGAERQTRLVAAWTLEADALVVGPWSASVMEHAAWRGLLVES